jgi:uncharacterized protein YfiM (DUF2279 family)
MCSVCLMSNGIGLPMDAVLAEQFHARIRSDNAMGLSRKDWLWSPNGAEVGVTSGDAAVSTGEPHASLHHRQ